MRLPRMTTRRWMIAVVVLALMMGGIVGGIRLKRRYDEFLSRAQLHAELEGLCQERASDAKHFFEVFAPQIRELAKEGRDGSPLESLLVDLRAMEDQRRESTKNLPQEMAYHAFMARKYRHAARYPWLPVEPDPPWPEP